jgi:hypothetical protein
VKATLLAVDLGLTGGLALYREDGALVWARSFRFATVAQFKRALPRLLDECGALRFLYVEGDKHLGDLWARAAEKRGAETTRVTPETWRARLLKAQDRASGPRAKTVAERRAREVIEVLAEKKPTSLATDAAEAILIGLYGALAVGWLDRAP